MSEPISATEKKLLKLAVAASRARGHLMALSRAAGDLAYAEVRERVCNAAQGEADALGKAIDKALEE